MHQVKSFVGEALLLLAVCLTSLPILASVHPIAPIPVRAVRLLALRFRNIDREKILADAITAATSVSSSGSQFPRKGVLRLIRVDGTDGGIVSSGKALVKPGEALLLPSGQLLRPEGLFDSSRTRVWALNKPAGWTSEGPEVQAWLEKIAADAGLDSFSGAPRAMMVGRLDKMTCGILLATNNGDLSQMLREPGRCSKEYVATVQGEVSKDTLKTLKAGIELSDGPVQFELAECISTTARKGSRPFSKLRLALSIGRNHIVKRALAHLGHQVLDLHRERFGPVAAGSICREYGSHRELSRQLVEGLWQTSGLPSWRQQKELDFLQREHPGLWQTALDVLSSP